MTEPTPEQIAKLPKWAQEHIIDLSRQREEAIREMNRCLDETTESPFIVDAFPCTGEDGRRGPVFKKRYIQTNKMRVVHAGVELSILLRNQGDNGDERICISWDGDRPRRICNRVLFVPTSFQAADILAIEKLRK